MNILKNKFKENIKLDYFYKFFTSFSITSAIWVLFLAYKGMNLIEIGMLEAIFHITSLLFEIPTGAIADLIGRRKVIVIGRVFSLVACLVVMTSSNFFILAIGFILDAISYNLNSGSEEALIYDSMKILNEEDSYSTFVSKLNLLIEISGGLAVFIGGALSEISFMLSYSIAIIINLIALFISLRFTEVEFEKRENKVTIKTHFIESFNVLKENKKLRNLLIYFPMISTFSVTVFFYMQQYFSDQGLSKLMISIIFLLHGIASGIGSLLSDKFVEKFNKRVYILIPLFISFSIILLAVVSGIYQVIAFCMLGFFSAMTYPISSNLINKLIPSEKRATILSVDSMMFSIGMIVLFPLVGFIGEVFSLSSAFISSGVLIFLITIYIAYKFK